MPCKKATEKFERSKFEKLSFMEATSLKMHFAMCKKCKDYQMYSDQLDELMSSEFGDKEVDESKINVSLTEQEKETLIAKLKNQL